MKRGIVFFLIALMLAAGHPGSGSAHPLDRLRQHMLIDFSPDSVDFTLAIGGGVLATEIVEGDLDPDLNGAVTAAESAAFAQLVLDEIDLSVGPTMLRIDPASVHGDPARPRSVPARVWNR